MCIRDRHVENELAEVSEPEKIEVDLTALEAHEQAELTERLSDYYLSLIHILRGKRCLYLNLWKSKRRSIL